MFTVIAKVTSKKDQVAYTKAMLQSLITPTRNEDGCILYDLHQDIKETHIFFFYETWKSEKDLDCHLITPHFTAFREQFDTLLEFPLEVFLLNKVENEI